LIEISDLISFLAGSLAYKTEFFFRNNYVAYNFMAVTLVVAVAIFSKNALFDEFL